MAAIQKRNASRFSVGVALDGLGWHPAAWRAAEHPEEVFTSAYWTGLAEIADRSGIDYLTLEDELHLQGAEETSESQRAGDDRGGSPAAPPGAREDLLQGRLDALLTLSWVAPRTERVGLIPTVTVTHTEPFHVGTALQTLDHISLGRAGWQLRISPGAIDAAAFGRRDAESLEPEALIAEAVDVAEVARRLWNSWERDAVIRDRATGRFLDRDKLHYVDFEGERFSVKGPSIVPRSPQGQLPVTLLAHRPEVFELAARVADVVFITPGSAAEAAEIVRTIRALEAEVDRDARGLAPLRIIVDLAVGIAADGTEDADGLEPFASDALVATGTAEVIADLIEEIRIAARIDGVRLRPLRLPLDLERIAELLVPLLRDRGIADPDPGSVQLRERFGLAPAEPQTEEASA